MLYARNLELSFGSRVILDDVSLSLLAKERVALVGNNGVGKSTLLKILAGEEQGVGQIEKQRHVRVGFLKQVPDLDNDLSVLETVRMGLSLHLDHIEEHQALCKSVTEATSDEARAKIVKKIDDLARQIETHGGFDVDYLVETVLSRLGIKARAQKIATLSGGERRRVDLARLLLLAPDIYLLDEPTNHLDVSAIEFLVETFSKSTAAILFVSHDARFIDELATKIIELANGKLFTHDPPFATYLENKLVRESIDARSLHRRERLMVGELVWLRSGTPARTTKQNARIERAYELIEGVGRDYQAQQKKRLEINAAKTKRLGNTILELKNVGAAYGDRILFRGVNLKVTKGQRIGILGPNGVGKSTLLSILSRKIEPTFGEVVFGKNTDIMQFDQQREQLDANKTLKETLADHGDYVHVGKENVHIASYLERYLFSPGDANRAVATLSGGEQNRLLLAKLFRHDANCLLLDEPTNDLDVVSLAVLEEAILDYDGVVFIVSHDRNFLDRVCTSVIAFEPAPEEGQHTLTLYSGNYSDYQNLKARMKKPAALESAATKPVKREERERTNKRRSFKEEREYQEIESVIEALETERAALHAEFAQPEFFRTEQALVEQKTTRLREVEQEIERLYARWQELSNLDN